MSISESLGLGASAMNAHSWGMAVTAHNVANVNTAGFEPQRATYATGPGGQGVRLEAVVQGQGLARPDVAERSAGLNAPGSANPQELLDAGASANAVAAAAAGLPPLAVNPSGTDLGREMTQMISTQRTYEGNAQTVRTSDDMLGVLLDIKA